MKLGLLILALVVVFEESHAGKLIPTVKLAKAAGRAAAPVAAKSRGAPLEHHHRKEPSHPKKSTSERHHKQDVTTTAKPVTSVGRIEYVAPSYGIVEGIIEATGTTVKRILAVYKQQPLVSANNYWIIYEGLKEDICILNVYITSDDTIVTTNTRCNHLIAGQEVEKH